MSTYVSSWVWRHSECDGTDLLLMLALADYANDEGVCWPGMLALSERCRCSTRTVQRNLAKAVERQDLEIAARVTSEGDADTNLYRFSKYCKQHPRGGDRIRRGGDKRGGGGDKWQNDEMSYKSSLQPSDQPSPNGTRENGVSFDGEEASTPRKVSKRSGDVKDHGESSKGKRPNMESTVEYCLTIELSKEDAEAIQDFWSMKGFVTGRTPIQDWQACIRTYKRQGWLPSLKGDGVSKPRKPSTMNGSNGGVPYELV